MKIKILIYIFGFYFPLDYGFFNLKYLTKLYYKLYSSTIEQYSVHKMNQLIEIYFKFNFIWEINPKFKNQLIIKKNLV